MEQGIKIGTAEKGQMKNPKLYSPLVLAYIGDAVYEVFMRDKVIQAHPDMPACKLHRETIKYVKASAQAQAVHELEAVLTEEELAVYKRGRNAKSPTVPKNADVTDYRCATGFEAMIGYLHLSGKEERLNELMKQAFEALSIKQ